MALSEYARIANGVANTFLFVCTLLQGFIWPTYIYIVMLFVHAVVGFSQKHDKYRSSGSRTLEQNPKNMVLKLLDTVKSCLFFTASHRTWFITDMVYFMLNLVMFHAHFVQISPSMTIALTRNGYPMAPTHTSIVSGKDTKKIMETWVDDDKIKIMFVEWPNDSNKEYNLKSYQGMFTASDEHGVQKDIFCQDMELPEREFSCFRRAIDFKPTDDNDVREGLRVFPMPSDKYKIELKVPVETGDNYGCKGLRIYRAVNRPTIHQVKHVVSDEFGPTETARITDYYKNFDYITAIGSNHSGALAPNQGLHHCMSGVTATTAYNGICTSTTKMYEASWYWDQFKTFCEKQSSWIQVPDRMDIFRKVGPFAVSEEIVVEDIFIVKGALDQLVARFSEVGGGKDVNEYFFGALWKQIPGGAPWDLKETWLLYTIFFLPLTLQMARAILRSDTTGSFSPATRKLGESETNATILLFFYGPGLFLFLSLGSWLCVAAIILMMWNNQEPLLAAMRPKNTTDTKKPSKTPRTMQMMQFTTVLALVLMVTHTVTLMFMLWPTGPDTQWLLGFSPYMSDYIASNDMYKAILSATMAPAWMSLMAMPSLVVCVGFMLCWLNDAVVLFYNPSPQ